MKLNIGIIFGGPSRQREQSFQNARSLFTNLDRQLFEPVPIFVDSHRCLYLLDWRLLFEKSLSDFFPGPEHVAFSEIPLPVYEESLDGSTQNDGPPALRENIIQVDTLPQLINFAIVALCGSPEEDEWAYTLLEAAHIPYAGHSPEARKYFKNFPETYRRWISKGVQTPVSSIIYRSVWKQENGAEIFQSAVQNLGLPFKIFSTADPTHYARIDQESDLTGFCEAVETSFYEERLPLSRWQEMNLYERAEYLQLLSDLRIGLGFPIYISVNKGPGTLVKRPQALLQMLNALVADPSIKVDSTCHLSSALPSCDVALQAIHAGKTFWITVIPSEQGPRAFAPIGRQGYHDPYGNGSGEWSENIFSAQESEAIRKVVEQMALDTDLKQVFTASGRITHKGAIYLEQVNTGIPFAPDSPLYLASAQAGLLPSSWLSALIYFNLQARIAEHPSEISWRGLLEYFLEILAGKSQAQVVGILYTAPLEKQTIPEGTGQIAQFLAADGHFSPVPLLMEQSENELYLQEQLVVPLIRGEEPVTSVLPVPGLFPPVPTLPSGRFTFRQLVDYAGVVFLDTRGVSVQGRLQRELKSHGIAFNGPGGAAAGVASHPFQCMEALRRNTDLVICGQILLSQQAFTANPNATMQRIESRFPYPFAGIATGLGTLSIQRREALEAFIRLLFRPDGTEGKEARKILRIKEQQHVPIQKEILFQELIRPHGAKYLLPMSVPLVSKFDHEGNPTYHFPGPVERPGERTLPLLQAQERPHFDQLAPEIKNAITDVSHKAAETAARVLNLQGAACVDLTVRIYENNYIEPVIEYLEVFPEWRLSDPVVRALIRHGEFPGTTLAGILRDSLAKPSLEKLALAAQTEHIFAPVPSAGALNLDQGPHPEAQAHNTTPSMENTPPPHTRSNIQEIRDRLPATGIVGLIQQWLLQFWYFISSTIFLKNLGAAILFIFLFVNLLSLGLKLYTNHGQAVEVQDYQGMTAREARRKAKSSSFTTIINDSIYVVGKAPNVVLGQTPKPGSNIKKNRFIYLTVSSSTPPNVPLPSLVGGNDDFEQYRKKLERLGIKARVKDREFNAELEENTILYLFFKGKRIEPGDLKRGVKVPKGSMLEVVVSIRNTGTVDIPDLVCRTYEEAIFLLQSSQLTIGSVFAPGEPLPWHYVYKQEPAFNPSIKLSVGEGINLYLQEEKPENCNEL